MEKNHLFRVAKMNGDAMINKIEKKMGVGALIVRDYECN
jgi:predicted RNA-binding protein YlxR (DUF448 family)